MILKYHRLLAVFIFSLVLFFAISASAQNKVVVIPLMEEAPHFEPYAPLADISPPITSYSLGTNYIVDKVTGLVWQQMDDNNLRTWSEAWDYCQDLSLGGETDWRLPSVSELMSIVDYNTFNPAINSVPFPGTNLMGYWSATTIANANGTLVFAAYVDFSSGDLIPQSVSLGNYVRCVRRLLSRDSVFKDNGNGTVTDLSTGLTWQRQDDNVLKEWTQAGPYCQGLDLAGGGWRLPNIKELQSIVDYRCHDPAIDAGAFPGTKSLNYVSATTPASNSESVWVFNFLHGYPDYVSKSPSSFYVRCVR